MKRWLRKWILSYISLIRTYRVCAFAKASIEEPSLFANLLPGCKPIASKSRRFSKEDQEFIHQETNRLLSEGIIEPSTSPWRAQVVISKDPLQRHKKCLCIDYSHKLLTCTQNLMLIPCPVSTTWSTIWLCIRCFQLLI